MDVLRALSSPNMDIRKKTLDIALDLITARNIDEVRRCAFLPANTCLMHCADAAKLYGYNLQIIRCQRITLDPKENA